MVMASTAGPIHHMGFLHCFSTQPHVCDICDFFSRNHHQLEG